MQKTSAILLSIALIFGLVSCGSHRSKRVILWTDRPEFAFYTEFFNTSQDRYKVEVRFFDSPAYRLTASRGEYPDIVAARWLKNSSTRSSFASLNGLISRGGLNHASFYQKLLSMGKIDRRQYLIPVSFNIPAVIFSRDSSVTPSNPFTIEMEEIREQGKAFNRNNGAVYSRMGFCPSADDDFLFLTAVFFGVSFREASPVAWNHQALGQSINWIQQWIREANRNIQTEEDFIFKHYHNTPDRLVSSGRTLYMYMNSQNYFTLPEERRINLDFRWIAGKDNIPVDDSVVCYGIHKRAKSRRGAEAFTRWFFNDETQKLLLEVGKNRRINETSFGIAGGFSAMKTVTEKVFPLYYPDLLGHIPPENSFLTPNNLPRNWMIIKERILLPYLRERISTSGHQEIRPLERRISDWYRLNRE